MTSFGFGTTLVVDPPAPCPVVVAPPAAPPAVVVPVPGPRGPAAAAPLVFTGTWSSFSTAHTYAYLPPVRVVAADGTEVTADVEYPDATHVAITFPAPFTGTILIG